MDRGVRVVDETVGRNVADASGPGLCEAALSSEQRFVFYQSELAITHSFQKSGLLLGGARRKFVLKTLFSPIAKYAGRLHNYSLSYVHSTRFANVCKEDT